jgi:hypothetical protein
MKQTQLDLDIHRVLEFFDSLLHRAEVRREVVLGIILDKREDQGKLVKQIVDCLKNRVQG